jgi:toxin ParE1/3/4
MAYEVRFRPLAEADLADLYEYLSEHAGSAIGGAYIDRIETLCRTLSELPRRGAPRDDLAPGIRTLNFERRAVIAYRVGDSSVTIVRVFYAGRDYAAEDLSG